jgi:2-oxoglutarate ferredoxin oxidoreductase subunit beta
MSFVRILQRCPIYSAAVYQAAVQDPARIALLIHDDGVVVPELDKLYRSQVAHDPHDLDAARRIADATDHIHLGVLYKDPSRPRYDEIRRVPPRTPEERVTLIDAELDRYAV